MNVDALETNKHYATWQGIEPDKRATLWLIKRYIFQDAYFTLAVPNGTMPKEAILFGVSSATIRAIRRANQQSMFIRLTLDSALTEKN